MNILNFGSCNIDYVYSLQHFVSAGETVSAEKLTEHAGGKGLNQSIAAALAGAKIFHAGNIGRDGLALKELLENKGVNTKFLNVTDERTGHAIIQLDESGENCIIVHSGANGLIDKSQIDDIIEYFGTDDICMLQNETPCVDYIIRSARKKRMTVVWNPSPINNKIDKENILLCNYVILNKTEGLELTGVNTAGMILNKLTEEYPNTRFVLTLGDKGSIFGYGNNRIKQNAFKTNPIDTTGAGDTFAGYFVAGLSNGKSIQETLLYSSAAASIATETLGAANSIPSLITVEKRMQIKQ